MIVFLDTNILLDVLIRREPFFSAAASIWTLAEKNKIRAYISAISFSNVFYLARKYGGKAIAGQSVKSMNAVFNTVAVDRQIIEASIQSGLEDFEDAIQFQCAKRCRAKILITRNPKHFPDNELTIMSSDQFVSDYPDMMGKPL